MKRKTILHIQPVAIILVLAILLCVSGVTYAAWSDFLTINGFFGTGSLNMVFDQSRPYSVQVTDINGQQAGSAISGDEISCILDEGKKQARLSFPHGVLLEELISADRFLKFQYPIGVGEDSTVQSVTAYLADLTAPSQEKVEFVPSDSHLVINGNEYRLPDGLAAFGTPLFWEAYRQIEVNDGQIVGTIFLKLSHESAEALRKPNELSLDAAALPEELKTHIIPDGDGENGLLQGELKVNYTVSFPLFIEQIHP